MAIFPISNSLAQLSAATPESIDQYRNGIRVKADNTVAYVASSAGLQSQNGFLLDANGAILYLDATAGLPADVVWRNGLPFNSSGALCVSTGPVATWSNGIPLAANGAVSAAVAGGDPFFANVSLLLHFEGVNGGTTFTDNSLNGFTPTVTPTARTATNQFKFGTSSGEMFSGGKLSYADNAAFELGNGDFTIETFKRFSALPGSGVAVRIGAKFESVGNQRSYAFYQFNNAGTQQLLFSYSSDGITGTDVSENYTPPTGVWLHYAVTRQGSNLRFFVDGVQIGTTKTVTATFFNGTAPYEIGTNSNGWFDEYRLTKGVARYTANFTPPTAPFPNS